MSYADVSSRYFMNLEQSRLLFCFETYGWHSLFSVPLAIYAFTLPLPYIGEASSLPTGFIAGAAVLVSGLLLYCWAPSRSPSHTEVS
ncbi:hypothetical protein BHE74_00027179 [Ensete ventricosum]|nr:hypothetical protein GW17_00016049 [Ensete ventricosum]RWW65514.1 hypothetical protein BHE74_00027179 [Ensete ventricosum]